MRIYIISIIVATIISAVINIITPEKWTKYVGVVTGLVITVCIAQPIISIMHTDIFSGFSYKMEQNKHDGEQVLHARIKEELESRISSDAEARIKKDFGKMCSAETEIIMAKSGEVKGIKSILIKGDKIDNVVIGRLRDIYAPEEVKYVGR